MPSSHRTTIIIKVIRYSQSEQWFPVPGSYRRCALVHFWRSCTVIQIAGPAGWEGGGRTLLEVEVVEENSIGAAGSVLAWITP